MRPDYYCRFVEIWRKLKTNCGNCSDIVWSIRSSRIGSFILDFIYGSDYFNGVIYIFIFFQIVWKRKRFAKKSLIFLHILAILDTTSVYKNYTYVHDFASMKRIFRDTTNKHIWNPREIQNGFLHKKRKFLVENQMCIRRRKFSVFDSTFILLFATKNGNENWCSFFCSKKNYQKSLKFICWPKIVAKSQFIVIVGIKFIKTLIFVPI